MRCLFRSVLIPPALVLAAVMLFSPSGLSAQDTPSPDGSVAVAAASVEPTDMAGSGAAESVTESTDAATDPAEESSEAEAPLTTAEIAYSIDNLLLFLSAVLVLFMQAGFAMVETGFNASKNAVNILCKNLMDMCIGVLLFWLVGYNLMYPGDAATNEYLSYAGGIGISEAGQSQAEAVGGKLNSQVDFFFQAVFAATAATIVSGAVAGRLKFSAYLIYSAFLTALIYPISGYWKWGGGWLNEMGFADFAGSLVVHACGGFAALAAAIVLGPRLGRFTAEGRSVPMPGHNLPLATLGVFILVVGWYGFNPGSQLAFTGTANITAVMLIAVNTTLAACAGGCTALIAAWGLFKKPDLSMALNGVLAGLVGITANCDCVSNGESMVIGGVAGVLVVLGILMLDKLRIDDPVGAFPVHGLCGVWGGIATGIFGGHDLGVQALGSVVIPAFSFVTMFALFQVLKSLKMLRVSPDEEIRGLDVSEHGMHAYEGFVTV